MTLLLNLCYNFFKRSTLKKRNIVIIASVLFCAIVVVGIFCLYTPKTNKIEYDGCYYWSNKEANYEPWKYVESPTGWEYYLYIPKNVDIKDENAKVPLIVTFHGQSGKYSSLTNQGRVFYTKEFQEKCGGCAILVMMSRGAVHYFSDPNSCARLIKNLTFKYPCLDMNNITGFGHSQGAAFVVELAIYDPGLFNAVISSSGYYVASVRDLLRVLPVQFWIGVSENDLGIFEPGSKTGKLFGKYCYNSRYIQFTNRGHFQFVLNDKSGKGDETLESWLINVMKNPRRK